MRLTRILCKQHIDRMFKKHWKIQGRKVPVQTGAEAELLARGIQLTDPEVVMKLRSPPMQFPELGVPLKPAPMDESHPLYKARPCYSYQENSVLIEGFKQAQVLTNSIQIKEGLPIEIENKIKANESQLPANLDDLVQRCIFGATLFDAYQEKLPKLKDPERPAFTFPRVYGVPDYRRNRLMIDRLLGLCAILGHGSPGLIVHDPKVEVSLERDDDLISWQVTPGALLCGTKPLKPLATPEEAPLPDIFPLKSTVSLQTTHFYEMQDIFPVPLSHPHAHTAWFNFNETKVTNLHEEPVVDMQLLGRTVGHTFALALAVAKHRFGSGLKPNSLLPEPVTLQGIQSDGRRFHFVVLQLNTLASQGVRNILWSSPLMTMFSTCQYEEGVPVITNYNPKVFSQILAFYTSGISSNK